MFVYNIRYERERERGRRITFSITANGLCALREDCQSQKYLIEIVMPA